MKLQDFSLEWYVPLRDAWLELAPRREDVARPEAALEFLVTEDGGTQWYQIGHMNAWFYLRGIIPRLSADFYFISTEPLVDGKDVKMEIQAAMREYDLRRLSTALPSPINPKFYLGIGFVQEGRLRDAYIYDGKYVDAVVFGFHREEVEKNGLALTDTAKVDPKKRKRRRRSRRKKTAASQGKAET